MLSGHGIYEDDEHHIPLNPGDFFQRLPGVKHTNYVSGNWSELYVVIGKPLYETMLDLNVLGSPSPVIHPGIDYETVLKFLHFHDQLGYIGGLELPLLVPDILSYLARIHYLSKSRQHEDEEADTLRMATEYIRGNLENRLSVEEVAAHVGMGYEKFRKLFTRHYHISPGNYIIHQRINHARKRLSLGISVKAVALELGYIDTFTFSKQFKKITGKTPSDYQKLYLL